MSLETVISEISALRAEIKSLTKIVRKIKAKQDDPDGTKAASRAKNNGFNREQAISPKLREFLGVEEGKLVSRSFVTRAINTYVTEKGLKHPDNGRVLVLDDKLRDLLEPPADTQVTFLNLQKFLSPHYTKVEQTA
ncbi:SWIB/MDM2 domain-containing protein [Flavobacteriales bacterium]|jgi:upstream activation factor subunit UAF30|nr:SWIB/MDM2 domain-containing protein [Flavobacteriales bacterium]|tara:strand:+ start:284 stop:691 length:408 start_codon:yes stop_codon:yes gene_type:complete